MTWEPYEREPIESKAGDPWWLAMIVLLFWALIFAVAVFGLVSKMVLDRGCV